MDNDGKPDIVVNGYYTNTLAIFKNQSTPDNISFSKLPDLQMGADPQNACIQDLDADGRSEIIITNVGSNKTSILRNTSNPGNIAFAPRVDYSTGVYPRSVSISDFDNDGKPDLAVTVQLGNTVSIFKNTCNPGTISFTPPINLVAGNQPYGIAVDDLNGDGLPDIAASNAGAGTVSIFKNTSSGASISFSSKTDFTTNKFPYSVYIADFDADGKGDLALGCPGDYFGEVSVLKNRVTEPAIFSFNPVNAYTGFEVTIKGSNFTTASSISFGGVAAKSFKVLSDSVIIAIVDSGRTGDVSITNKYGSSSLAGFTFTAPPVINSFTPFSGGRGDIISIFGSNFLGATSVKFGGVEATFFNVASSGTAIYASVDTGATGAISVTTATGTGTRSGFIFIPKPFIRSFTPATCISGTTVKINGSNFTGATSVSFGGVPASSFIVDFATGITAIVGAGASGNVSVTTANGTASLSGFSFVGPVITSFTPIIADAGTIVTITGSNFTGVTDVRFGGTPTTSFTVVSSTTIRAIAGTGSSGNVSVITANGTATLPGFTFGVPTITSVAPASGPVGATVTIIGINFNPQRSGNTVFFGAVQVIVSSATSTQLNVTVPAGATYEQPSS